MVVPNRIEVKSYNDGIPTSVQDDYGVGGVPAIMRQGFPSSISLNQADTGSNGGSQYITYVLPTQNFERTTYTHSSKMGDLIMFRNHIGNKPIGDERIALQPHILNMNLKFMRDVLTVIQCNSIMHRDFVKLVEEKEKAEIAANERVNPDFYVGPNGKLLVIDYNKYFEDAMAIGRSWRVGGFSMIPEDTRIHGESNRGQPRVLTLGLRGNMDCVNLWGSNLISNDSIALVLKMVRVEPNAPYRTELMTTVPQTVPVIPGFVIRGDHWVPRYVAVSFPRRTPPVALCRTVLPVLDSEGDTRHYPAPYYYIGVVDHLNTGSRELRRLEGNETQPLNCAQADKNPWLRVRYFIS